MKNKISYTEVEEALIYCQARLINHGVTFSIKAIRGPSRVRELNGIRALIVLILRTDKDYSFAKIGAIINRDHASAIHLFNNYDKFTYGRLETYELIKYELMKENLLRIEIIEREKILSQIETYDVAIKILKLRLK